MPNVVIPSGGLGVLTPGLISKYVNPTPPSITSQPLNQTVTQGLTASLSVVAGGTAPRSYQWRYLGNNLVGATGATLILNNVQLVQAGNYSVTVSNVAGTVASAPPSRRTRPRGVRTTSYT